MKAHRGDIHDDPVVFAVTDKASLFCAFSISMVFLFSMNGSDFYSRSLLLWHC